MSNNEVKEIKFLLKLLGYPNYRSNLNSTTFRKLREIKNMCPGLRDRELIDYTREISAVRILPAGRTLVQQKPDEIPIHPQEFKLLKTIAASNDKIAPTKIKFLKSEERELILIRMSKRGLIAIEWGIQAKKAQVWLTPRGVEYLLEDYTPQKGLQPAISLDLLSNYLRFFRKQLHSQPTSAPVTSTDFSDEGILEIIQKLDRELGTENYLPIFHLREKLQPPLSRDELDKALYRLQRTDKIELSSLQEVTAYTPAQIDAGIPQEIGGSLFFIMVN